MRTWLVAATLSIPLLQVGAISSEAASETIKFAPHRAIYDVSLGRSAPGSGITEMSGRLVYELKGGVCEDYVQSMRFVTRSSSSDGSQQINDMRTTSAEEADGQRLRFTSSQFHDAELGEVIEGRARRPSATDEVSVELMKPAAKALSFPAGTYFPIQHSIAMLKAAMAGQPRFAADVYDGSDKGDKISETMTIIGKPRSSDIAVLPAIPNIERLKTLRFWPIATSYFDKGKALLTKDALPNYELAAQFYENGVSTRLVMDYGEFSLKGELKELMFLDEPACPKGQ